MPRLAPVMMATRPSQLLGTGRETVVFAAVRAGRSSEAHAQRWMAARFVGASVSRKEDRRLLTGHGTYVDDIAVAGVVQPPLPRSDVGSGRIVGIDTAAAAAVEGVRAVLLAADLDAVLAGPIRPTLTLGDL